jgi:hypothetical protein
VGAVDFGSRFPVTRTAAGAYRLWALRVLPRLSRKATRSAEQSLLDFALAAELLAAAVHAGVSTQAALAAISPQFKGIVGVWMTAVRRSLALGTGADIAWSCSQPHDTRAHPARPDAFSCAEREAAMTFGRLMSAGDMDGVSPRLGLRELARQLRADVANAELERARRAGIAVVGPLGLCFLPAFVLVSVVPVVASAFRQILW